jgi:dipeptidyl aminopeptidase/acylaminoacyl peptidase
MSPHNGFDEMITDLLASTAAGTVADAPHAAAMAAVRRSRQRPTWHATVHQRVVGGGAALVNRADVRGATIAIAFIALLLAIAALVPVIGSWDRLAPSLGLAGNGIIAFDAGGAIYAIDSLGTVPRRFADSSTNDSAPAFSPDGSSVAYWSTDAATRFTLRVAPTRGGSPTDVALDPGAVPETTRQPAWASDNRRLAFTASSRGIERLFVVALDDAGLHALPIDGITPWNPAWSPDGAWISFIGSSMASAQDVGLWVIHPDGTGLRRLNTSPLPRYSLEGDVLRWAPIAGREALLYHFGPDGQYDIAIYDLATDRETTVSRDPANEFWASWAPDASRVAWFRDGGIQVATVDASDSVGPARSALAAPEESGGDGSGGCGDPVDPAAPGCGIDSPPLWSPDGTSVYAFDGRSLLVLTVDGSRPVRWIPLPAAPGSAVTWQRVP